MNNIMLDLETLGTKKDAVIMSISAVRFDINNCNIVDEFFCNVKIQSSIDLGNSIDGSTLEWWFSQSKEAQNSLIQNPISIKEALFSLSSFISNTDIVWGNSNSFDCSILENSYNKLKMNPPWKYWNERDLRTLVAINPDIKRNIKFDGIKHNALDDCKFQIKYLCAIIKSLNL